MELDIHFDQFWAPPSAVYSVYDGTLLITPMAVINKGITLKDFYSFLWPPSVCHTNFHLFYRLFWYTPIQSCTDVNPFYFRCKRNAIVKWIRFRHHTAVPNARVLWFPNFGAPISTCATCVVNIVKWMQLDSIPSYSYVFKVRSSYWLCNSFISLLLKCNPGNCSGTMHRTGVIHHTECTAHQIKIIFISGDIVT